MAMGNATVAEVDPHMSTVFNNPAALAKLKGRHFEVEMLMLAPDLDVDFYAPRDENGDFDYGILGLDGTGFNRYDPTVPRDPVVGPDGFGSSHTDKTSIYIPGYGLQQAPLSAPSLLPAQIGFSVNPPGSKFTFGNKNYMMSANNVFKDAENKSRFLGKEAAIQRYTYFSPAIGYEVSEEWAVGFGVQISHQGFYAAQESRSANILPAVTETLQDAFSCEFDKPIGQRRDPLMPWLSLCQGNVGPWDTAARVDLDMQETLSTSYNLGVLWEPTEWLSWGASYLSESKVKLKGRFLVDYTDEWTAYWNGYNSSIQGAITAAMLGLPRGVPFEAGHVNLDLTQPQIFKTGFRVRLSPEFTLNMQATWTDWSAWRSWLIEFDRPIEALQAATLLTTKVTNRSLRLEPRLEDTWHYGFGLVRHINSRLDVRFGLELRTSPVQKEYFGPIPIGDAKLWGLGFGYQWDKATQISASMFYMQSTEFIPSNTSSNLNSTALNNVPSNPYGGLDVKFNTRVSGLGVVFRRNF